MRCLSDSLYMCCEWGVHNRHCIRTLVLKYLAIFKYLLVWARGVVEENFSGFRLLKWLYETFLLCYNNVGILHKNM